MKQKPTDYRNRIKALEYVDAADLTAHPGNWREHPQAQAEAMRGVLAEVGIAGALLAYRSERQGGALVVIDGHLRKDAAPQRWPVLILDVDDAEADYILATHDPLAAMATADAGALDALLSSVQSGEAAVMAMLAELAEGAGLYAPREDTSDDPLSLAPTASLADRFLVPPFSVLDARQGYWQDRKRAWIALGIESELGRGGDIVPNGSSRPPEHDGARLRHGRANATPGGSPRPAATLNSDGKTDRGDGKGRPIKRGGHMALETSATVQRLKPSADQAVKRAKQRKAADDANG